MSGVWLALEILTYGLALWLGLYLLGRDPAKPRLRYAAAGLVAYAFSLATALLGRYAADPAVAQALVRLHWSTLFLPALFWFGTVVQLLPEATPPRQLLSRLWRYALPPLALGLYLLSVSSNLVFDFSSGQVQAGPAYFLFAALTLLPLLAALLVVARLFSQAQSKKPLGLLLAATLFVTLGAGLMVYPLQWLAQSWLLLAISLDFIALGVAIAWLDAFEEGERLLPDFVRSFDGALLMVLLFGGPVVVTMALSSGLTFAMLSLLLLTIALAIAVQTLADPLQTALDRLAFKAFPRLRQERAELRSTASLLPRVNEGLDPNSMEAAEFRRLTRRALSHMGNLPRLATSPLTQLSIIYARLAERGAPDETLERAAELKQLLTESICQLKPPGDEPFGTSDEWRHYNALYFPYVIGLKPYSRRADHNGLDPVAEEALDWFRTYVPERTLYNWQNAAARLVAQNLRERAENTP